VDRVDWGRVSWGRWVLGGLAALLALGVGLFLLRDAGLPDLRRTVQSAGLWAPLLFVLLQGTVTVAPVPRTVFTVAAGVLFGSISGLLLTITGTALAAATAYGLVRLVGGRFAERHADRSAVVWVRSRLETSGLLAMVSLRLIPALPFAPLNYALALAKARFGPYVLGTVLGVLPGTVSVVVLGDAAVGGNPHPAMFVVSLISGAIGLTGAALAVRRGRPPAPAPES
jgi:uncharacterized membrane protein YdjX (TVP38/TMEM64 family)